MIKIDVSVARRDFADVMKNVRNGERVILRNHGKSVAAIVSVEDLALLEAIENRHDLEVARQALLEVAEKGAIMWEEAKRQLGLS